MLKLQFYLDMPSLQVVICNDRYVVPFSGGVPATFAALGLDDATEVAGPYTVQASMNGKIYCEAAIGLTWIEHKGQMILGMVAEDFMELAAALAKGGDGKAVTLEFIPRGSGLLREPLH